jgi:hypothetical protein
MERFFIYKGDKDIKNIEYFMNFAFLIVLLFILGNTKTIKKE